MNDWKVLLCHLWLIFYSVLTFKWSNPLMWSVQPLCLLLILVHCLLQLLRYNKWATIYCGIFSISLSLQNWETRELSPARLCLVLENVCHPRPVIPHFHFADTRQSTHCVCFLWCLITSSSTHSCHVIILTLFCLRRYFFMLQWLTSLLLITLFWLMYVGRALIFWWLI